MSQGFNYEPSFYRISSETIREQQRTMEINGEPERANQSKREQKLEKVKQSLLPNR